MYPITHSPSVALDLAHAVMDEQRRRAAVIRPAADRPASRSGDRVRAWRPSAWIRRPAVAI